jgi:hypothetical protein
MDTAHASARWLRLLALGALACALLVPAVGAAATLVRGPYLQLLTTASVTVVWTTDVASPCALRIAAVGSAPTVVTGGTATVCAIPVTGLLPGTEYAYVPLSDGVPLTSESVFRSDDPEAPFTFLVVGDSGSGGPKQYVIRDAMLDSPADFIVHTGDMIYEDGSAADFDPKFFVPYAPLLRRIPLWPSIGNHDVRTASGAPWREAFYTPANNPAANEKYYSFDVGNAHFTVLDSNAGTAPGTAQHTFVEADLAATTAQWKFVVFHHPVYSSGSHGGNLALQENLVPLFDRYAVDLVLTGHDHDYERTLPLVAHQPVAEAGTVYIVTGGGGHSIRTVRTSPLTA